MGSHYGWRWMGVVGVRLLWSKPPYSTNMGPTPRCDSTTVCRVLIKKNICLWFSKLLVAAALFRPGIFGWSGNPDRKISRWFLKKVKVTLLVTEAGQEQVEYPGYPD